MSVPRLFLAFPFVTRQRRNVCLAAMASSPVSPSLARAVPGVASPAAACPLTLDRTVERVAFAVPRPFFLRVDTTPFIIFYSVAVFLALTLEGNHSLFAWLSLPALALLHCVLLLTEYWSYPARLRIAFRVVGGSATAAASSPAALACPLDPEVLRQASAPSGLVAASSPADADAAAAAAVTAAAAPWRIRSPYGSIFAPLVAGSAPTGAVAGAGGLTSPAGSGGLTYAEAACAYLSSRAMTVAAHEGWALYSHMFRLKIWEVKEGLKFQMYEAALRKNELEARARAGMTQEQRDALRPLVVPPMPRPAPRPQPSPVPATRFHVYPPADLAGWATAPASGAAAAARALTGGSGAAGWFLAACGLTSGPLELWSYVKPAEHCGPESLEPLQYDDPPASAAVTAPAPAFAAVAAAPGAATSQAAAQEALDAAAAVATRARSVLADQWTALTAAVSGVDAAVAADSEAAAVAPGAPAVPALTVTHTHRKLYWSPSLPASDPLMISAAASARAAAATPGAAAAPVAAPLVVASAPVLLPVAMPDSGPLTAYLSAPYASTISAGAGADAGADADSEDANADADTPAAAAARSRFGPNSIPLEAPSFASLFVQHAMAPFFVFQVFCVALWMLDEIWYYSLFTLFMIVTFESMLVWRRISQTSDLLSSRPPVPAVFVFRRRRWIAVRGDDVVPGDVVSVVSARTAPPTVGATQKTHQTHGQGQSTAVVPADSASASASASAPAPTESVVPCDCVLLHGSAVANEAVLTGESLPQVKDGLWDADDVAALLPLLDSAADAAAAARAAPSLDTAVRHRRHVLFAGTKVLLTTSADYNELNTPVALADANPDARARARADVGGVSLSLPPPPPDGGVPAVAVRTGFSSTQGALLRTILAPPANSSSAEALAFIAVLLVCACVSAYFVLEAGLADPTRSRYKLALNVITILTSVVPPELPIQLSMSVNNSLSALVRDKVYCTEPFRIPDAGGVEVCCFDKTGTLTEDEFKLVGVCGLPASSGGSGAGAESTEESALLSPRELSDDVRLVLGACHGLMRVPAAPKPKKPVAPATAAAAAAAAAAESGSVLNASVSAAAAGASSGEEWEVIGDPMEQTSMTAADFSFLPVPAAAAVAAGKKPASNAAAAAAALDVVVIAPSNGSARRGCAADADAACARVGLPAGSALPAGTAAGGAGAAVRHTGPALRARTLHRYAFSSNLKRMSVIVALEHSSALRAPGTAAGGAALDASKAPCLRVLCKGAPETLLPLFTRASVPDAAAYARTSQYWALRGCRVLALGFRDVPPGPGGWVFEHDGDADAGAHSGSPHRHVSAAVSPFHPPPRAAVECGLTFAGFLVLRTPLKRDSRRVVSTLRASGHHCVMITGDHVLTAVHVGRELGMLAHKKPVMLLETAAAAGPAADEAAGASSLSSSNSSGSASGGGGSRSVSVAGAAFQLRSLDGTTSAPFDLAAALNFTGTGAGAGSTAVATDDAARKSAYEVSPYTSAIAGEYSLAVTGEVLEVLSRAADRLAAHAAHAAATAAAGGPASPAAHGASATASLAAAAAAAVAEGAASSVAALAPLFPHISVFARTLPDQKEGIVAGFKSLGLTTLMCGDGTNDVGALKQSHVGVALLSADPTKKSGRGDGDEEESADDATLEAEEKEEKRLALLPKAEADRQRGLKVARKMAETNSNIRTMLTQVEDLHRQAQAHPKASAEHKRLMTAAQRSESMMLTMVRFMAGMGGDGSDDGDATAKFGDASISAPFTAKHSSVRCVLDIIRQGRCALVTAMQMYQILALNCLISAYSMSALYLKGIKMGDAQMTVSGMSMAFAMMAVTRAEPVIEISRERPYARIFSPWMMLTVVSQFAVHLFTLVTAVNMAMPYTASDTETLSPEGKFAPNVLNTTVWLVSTAMSLATILANYRGRPFMGSLGENGMLKKVMLITYSLLAVLAFEVMPELNQGLELAPLPTPEYQTSLVVLLLFDVLASYAIGRGLTKWFAKMPKGPAAEDLLALTEAAVEGGAPAAAAASKVAKKKQD
jgi:magnesium-transporting ATPase (P-type)